jgi:hypothetical protein
MSWTCLPSRPNSAASPSNQASWRRARIAALADLAVTDLGLLAGSCVGIRLVQCGHQPEAGLEEALGERLLDRAAGVGLKNSRFPQKSKT